MSYVTNAEQFKYMVNWMCKYPDIGRGFPRNMLPRARQLMEKLVVELNRLGPPIKPIETWRKVWSDYRNSTRRKFREHYTRERTHRFSELEERVIDLMELRSKTEQTIKERSDKKRQLSNRIQNLKRQNTNGNDFDDDDNEDEMDGREGELVDMNTMEAFSEQSKDMSEEDIKNVSEIENTNTSVTTKRGIEMISTPIQNQPQLQRALQTQTKRPAIAEGKVNDTDSRVQMATLRVLQRIERQLNRLNDTEDRNFNIMEENNKLLKLLIYRTTINKK